jgi:hypothetical protein
MPFACCAACGNVVSRPHGLAGFGRPVGGCPECGRTMYWTATPFAQRLLGTRAAPGRNHERATESERLSA